MKTIQIKVSEAEHTAIKIEAARLGVSMKQMLLRNRITSYNPKSPTEVMAEMKPEDVPESMGEATQAYELSKLEAKKLNQEIDEIYEKRLGHKRATFGDKPKPNFKKSK